MTDETEGTEAANARCVSEFLNRVRPPVEPVGTDDAAQFADDLAAVMRRLQAEGKPCPAADLVRIEI